MFTKGEEQSAGLAKNARHSFGAFCQLVSHSFFFFSHRVCWKAIGVGTGVEGGGFGVMLPMATSENTKLCRNWDDDDDDERFGEVPSFEHGVRFDAT